MPSATLTAGSAAGDSASRRWSIAKSVGNASLASSLGHHASLEKQPSLQVNDFLNFFIYKAKLYIPSTINSVTNCSFKIKNF